MSPPSFPPRPTDSALFTEAMPPARLFFGLQGRIGRGTYWLAGVLGLLAVGLAGMGLLRVAGLSSDRAESVVNLVLAWPAIAISVKRWHDRDRSGWWVLINLVPLIGWLWAFIDNGFMRGTPGPNRFGDVPQQASSLR